MLFYIKGNFTEGKKVFLSQMNIIKKRDNSEALVKNKMHL